MTSLLILVILPSFPVNAFKPETFTVLFKRRDLGFIRSLRDLNGFEVVNFIRHPATVSLLSEKLGLKLEPSSELYEYKPGDHIFIVTLKRPERGKEVKRISEKDLLVYEAIVTPGSWL